MTRNCYAHTLPGEGPRAWEPLHQHLADVADRASDYARAFNASDLARMAGLWHDLGKFSDEFQDYLLLSSAPGTDASGAHPAARTVDHSTAGAQRAGELGARGWPIAFCIAGHHGGLPDGRPKLAERLEQSVPATPHAPLSIIRPGVSPDLPRLRADPNRSIAFQAAFFTRMLFSTLVDADFLATEAFMSPDRSVDRARTLPTLAALAEAADQYIDRIATEAPPSVVNNARAGVLAACRAAAAKPPGFFTLTVPTGGGKTLASLSFALRHASAQNLRRVIYGVPFTSIIEQNAHEFRKALGAEAVLEHHHAFDAPGDDHWSRLAAENWDAPVVVTTNVQLLESCFANRPARCRKLHRVAKSVIVLDEAQAIPVELLEPTLAALDELVRNYGCTIVLCTATQPALVLRKGFPIGLRIETGREIATEVPAMFNTLRRVRVEKIRRFDLESLANAVAAEPRSLCIVHTKAEAVEVFAQVMQDADEDSLVHLSTNMCPAHRTAVIDDVRQRLKEGKPCRVISTSLIEAGVDLDFPVVFRAVAGLDAIAQAAGRCNREGLLPAPGRVIPFERTDRSIPKSMHALYQAAQDARLLLEAHDEPLLPKAIEAYFKEHYWRQEPRWDAHRVMACFPSGADDLDAPGLPPKLQFASAAERYRMISDDQRPVVVPYGDVGRALVRKLRELDRPASREFRRRCQRFAVACRSRTLDALLDTGVVHPADEHFAAGLYYLADADAYDDRHLGLQQRDNPDAGLLVI